MARTLSVTTTMNWPVQDGKNAAQLVLTTSLTYTQMLVIEKVYSSPVAGEAITLPMTSAKFLILQSLGTEDVEVFINGSTDSIMLKAGDGYVVVQNPDGAVTSLEVTVAAEPATLQGYAFA